MRSGSGYRAIERLERARWSRWKIAVVFAGLAAVVFAVALISWASPSPHGYIEFLVGFPLLLLGFSISGLGIVLQGRPFGLLLRSWGWVSFLGGLGLLTWIMLFIAGVLPS